MLFWAKNSWAKTATYIEKIRPKTPLEMIATGENRYRLWKQRKTCENMLDKNDKWSFMQITGFLVMSPILYYKNMWRK